MINSGKIELFQVLPAVTSFKMNIFEIRKQICVHLVKSNLTVYSMFLKFRFQFFQNFLRAYIRKVATQRTSNIKDSIKHYWIVLPPQITER